MRKTRTLDAAYFDGLYQANPDPWAFETSAYERDKYAHTLAALGKERAGQALEVGCSIGILTAKLARRCGHLTATDVSEAALAQARRRCAAIDHIRFQRVSSQDTSVDGPLDLIVLSEVVYYWDGAHIAAFAANLERALTPGGRILLVHWLGETDYPHSADDAVRLLKRHMITHVYTEERAERSEGYRLDLWRRIG